MICPFLNKRVQKGFTLIELMIVIAIIGILVSIAIPLFSAYKQRGYNAAAKSDVKNTYVAAQAYFNDYPRETISNTSNIIAYGFNPTLNVYISSSGTLFNLSITGSHISSNPVITYSCSSTGVITP
jgi:prepilin-type N-terminal cleavage/methylation domain-containing protein